MSMFTDRELAALRRMGKRVRVEYSRYWRSSWEGPNWHISVRARPIPNRGGWADYACGRIQGAPTETRSVPAHDLRFMAEICPRCLAVLAQRGVPCPVQARHGHARPEVGLGAAPQRKLMRYAAQTAEEEETL